MPQRVLSWIPDGKHGLKVVIFFKGCHHRKANVLSIQCDQIGQNFAIWANFFCLGRNFFQEFIYYWAIFWAKFYLLWANFFPSLFTIGRIFSEIWANFFSNRLVTLLSEHFFNESTNKEAGERFVEILILRIETSFISKIVWRLIKPIKIHTNPSFELWGPPENWHQSYERFTSLCLQTCEYKCFLKPLVVACAAKIYPLTLEFTCKYRVF